MTRTSENDDHKPSALSRRDFLKYGVATEAVVGALHLGVQPRGVEAAPPVETPHGVQLGVQAGLVSIALRWTSPAFQKQALTSCQWTSRT